MCSACCHGTAHFKHLHPVRFQRNVHWPMWGSERAIGTEELRQLPKRRTNRTWSDHELNQSLATRREVAAARVRPCSALLTQ
jgi:hypothetical protein